MPQRNYVAGAILLSTDLWSEEGRATIKEIYNLCVDDNRGAYRPDEQPIDGRCPYKDCLIPMKR